MPATVGIGELLAVLTIALCASMAASAALQRAVQAQRSRNDLQNSLSRGGSGRPGCWPGVATETKEERADETDRLIDGRDAARRENARWMLLSFAAAAIAAASTAAVVLIAASLLKL